MAGDFKKAQQILKTALYENGANWAEPVACRMHDAFGSLNGRDGRHNCLGCNFADATIGINHALEKINASSGSLEQNFTDYILWLYLFVERVNIIFAIVKLPESVRCKHYGIFVTVKRWANFLKHPNWFILVHHPKYFCEGDPKFHRSDYSAVVDSEFVRENFSAEATSRDASVRQQLQNKIDIAVLFPDPEKLTAEFCDAAKNFFELTAKNDVYREVLSDMSTYENYFSEANNVVQLPGTAAPGQSA